MANDSVEGLSSPTDAHTKTAFMGPAPAVNRFFASFAPTGLRLAFLEEGTDATPYFRAAVTMSPQDGIGLYKMLQVALHDIEVEIARQMATQHDPK